MPTATENKQETVTFVSFLHDQRVIVKPARPSYLRDPAGNVIGAETLKGKDAQFENRRFETDDPEIIEHLRNHSRANTRRGWREDFDAGRPTVPEQTEAIAVASAEADADALRNLIEAEESTGHGRDEVLAPARAALERLDEMAEQVAAVDAEASSETSDDAPEDSNGGDTG